MPVDIFGLRILYVETDFRGLNSIMYGTITPESYRQKARNIASVASGLREKLALHARVPGPTVADADRLECMLLNGYDPYFERRRTAWIMTRKLPKNQPRPMPSAVPLYTP